MLRPMLVMRLRASPAKVSLLLGVLVLLLTTSGCQGAAKGREASVVRFAGQENLTGEQRLQVVLNNPGVVGLVVGKVVGGREQASGAGLGTGSRRFDRWKFRVERTVGAAPLYPEGSTVALLAPGEQERRDDTPSFEDGERVGLFVQRDNLEDDGGPRDSLERVVVRSEKNVARYDRDAVTWDNFSGSVGNFESVLAGHPHTPSRTPSG